MVTDVLTAQMLKAINELDERLGQTDYPWYIGGSTGLLLQGVELPAHPRDLDIYCDPEMTDFVYRHFCDEALAPPATSRTDLYFSHLLRLELEGVSVEWVGGFEVLRAGSHYKVPRADSLRSFAPVITLEKTELRLMPLAHELVFNWLRKREDRYRRIAGVMAEQPDYYLQQLDGLLRQSFLMQSDEDSLKSMIEIKITK